MLSFRTEFSGQFYVLVRDNFFKVSSIWFDNIALRGTLVETLSGSGFCFVPKVAYRTIVLICGN